ncbi:MAG: acyl-CoA dehydrogenase family protein, partial [Novosphingobium sp.]
EAGFHGVGIPEEFGGQGGDVLMQMLLARELARSLGGLAWIWGITSFAGSKSIGLYGSEEQKKTFLPLIAAGQLKAAIAFTEPAGGTDLLGAMTTTAERVDGGWKINGEKIWSSSAHVADYLLVIARSDKAAEKKHQGLTLFWVPTKTAGVKITPLAKLGMRAMGSCSIHFEDAFVPDELVLGEPHKAWYMLLPTLNNERIMVGAFCLGVIDGVLEDAVDYMKQRKAFGGIIGRFQSLQHYVADIATMQKTTELMMMYCADRQSRGEPVGVEANMLKLMASENANQAADLGIQILGGMGYSAETDMQRYWRDSRLWRIGPITNEMVRNGIAESLGLPRSY